LRLLITAAMLPGARRPNNGDPGKDEIWPALPLEAWEATRATLHMWTQIVGKIRLALAPPVNHWWHVPFYVSTRGLTTSPIPYEGDTFEIVFDFIGHTLLIGKSNGTATTLPLAPKSVAAFYFEVMEGLASLGIAVKIWTTPVEVSNPVPFEQDHSHASYDPRYALRFWQVLVAVDEVLKEFRGRFHRQGEPGAFLLGQLRYRSNPLFRPPCTRTPWRRSDHARSLFP
jgi:hypothetical protein